MSLAKYLDSTYLDRGTSRDKINELIADAIKYKFTGLCITPGWVSYAKRKIGSNPIKIVTVPNWKMGGGLDSCEGIAEYVCEIADEVDYIWNVYSYADIKTWERTKRELAEIRKATKGTLKIIIESYYLRTTDENVYKLGLNKVYKEACKLVQESGADWIKTDSGLFNRPTFETLVDDCKLILKHSKIPVKAAGGITTKKQVDELIKLGIKRIGSSNSKNIVLEGE